MAAGLVVISLLPFLLSDDRRGTVTIEGIKTCIHLQRPNSLPGARSPTDHKLEYSRSWWANGNTLNSLVGLVEPVGVRLIFRRAHIGCWAAVYEGGYTVGGRGGGQLQLFGILKVYTDGGPAWLLNVGSVNGGRSPDTDHTEGCLHFLRCAVVFVLPRS